MIFPPGIKEYKGWSIHKQHSNHPVTGKWRARKLGGIKMGASTYQQLMNMIRVRRAYE